MKAVLLVAVLLGCGGKHFGGDADADADMPCEDGTRLGGAATGLVLCTGSEDVYRVGAAQCDASVGSCTVGVGTCSSDGDCGAAEVCVDVVDACTCVTPCIADADCADDELCLCEAAGLNAFSRCLPAGCRSGEDCPGGECALSRDLCFEAESFECRRPTDECAANGDCPAGLYCGHDPAAFGWYCEDRGSC